MEFVENDENFLTVEENYLKFLGENNRLIKEQEDHVRRDLVSGNSSPEIVDALLINIFQNVSPKEKFFIEISIYSIIHFVIH